MHPLIHKAVLDCVKGAGLAVLFTSPMVVVLWSVSRVRKEFRAAEEFPFRELPLRAPGESLRVKMERLAEAQQHRLLMLTIVAVVSTAVVLSLPADLKLAGMGICALLVFADALRTIPRMIHTQRELWNCRLGFTGERLVGEELNQLLADGFQVFHDIPLQGYNVDHVIVGPTGVFAVETNTRRRSRKASSPSEQQVRYDGDTLIWPTGKDTGPVDQALFNARSLGHWLSSSTGGPVKAQGIVTLPGWSIEDCDRHRVWTSNPKRIKSLVTSHHVDQLSSDHIQRIAYQLTERSRLRKVEA